MKFLKFTKRQNEFERCVSLWTPWVTVVWDFGSIICKGTDEFELVIKHLAWGPVFYWGNRDVEKLGERDKFDRLQFTKVQPRYAELRKRRTDERDFHEHKEQQVRQGKKKNPADMTYAERHAATMEAVKKMKFSDNFVHLMTTPVSRIMLDRGEVGYDDVTGELLTEEWFAKDKEKNNRLAPPNAGILSFKKAEDGEGYTMHHVPGAELRQVQSGVQQVPQLGEGQ